MKTSTPPKWRYYRNKKNQLSRWSYAYSRVMKNAEMDGVTVVYEGVRLGFFQGVTPSVARNLILESKSAPLDRRFDTLEEAKLWFAIIKAKVRRGI